MIFVCHTGLAFAMADAVLIQFTFRPVDFLMWLENDSNEVNATTQAQRKTLKDILYVNHYGEC